MYISIMTKWMGVSNGRSQNWIWVYWNIIWTSCHSRYVGRENTTQPPPQSWHARYRHRVESADENGANTNKAIVDHVLRTLGNERLSSLRFFFSFLMKTLDTKCPLCWIFPLFTWLGERKVKVSLNDATKSHNSGKLCHSIMSGSRCRWIHGQFEENVLKQCLTDRYAPQWRQTKEKSTQVIWFALLTDEWMKWMRL